jgi:hypothetical protein
VQWIAVTADLGEQLDITSCNDSRSLGLLSNTRNSLRPDFADGFHVVILSVFCENYKPTLKTRSLESAVLSGYFPSLNRLNLTEDYDDIGAFFRKDTGNCSTNPTGGASDKRNFVSEFKVHKQGWYHQLAVNDS